MENVEKLKKFILDNNLYFEGDASELNSDCCIISGYALFIGADTGQINEAIDNVIEGVGYYEDELERVFEFAEDNNYGKYWSTPDAKKKYKF